MSRFFIRQADRGKCEWRWLRGGFMFDVCGCSVCGYEIATSITQPLPEPRYCPGCGRKVVP